MAQNNLFYESDLTFDNVITYKGLDFYPVRVLDYYDFSIGLGCLLIDQFQDVDINQNYSILQMSYLDYLFYCDERDESLNLLLLLIELLGVSMRQNFFDDNNFIYVEQDEKGRKSLIINGVTINGKDFNNIKSIICAQNDIDISIFDLDPQVRQKLWETMQLQESRNRVSVASFEEQIISVMLVTSYNVEQIKNLTLRKFKKILARADHKMHYEIYESARVGGFVTMQERYPHWLSNINNSVFNNISSYDEVKGKIETKVS